MAKGVKIAFSFIPLPADIFQTDDIPTRGELLLLAYLSMHQTRFGHDSLPMSDEELVNGKKRSNGTRFDAGCGIKGVNNLKDARARLEKRGWLETWKEDRRRFYKLVIAHDAFVAEVSETDSLVSKSDSSDCPKRTPQLSETDSLTVQNGQCNKEYKKSIEKKERKPSAAADGRFTPTHDFIKRCCEHAKVPFVWDGSEAKHLSTWLSAVPGLDIEAIRHLVRNRFRSKDPPGRRPREWIQHLSDYATGPLDRFNKEPDEAKQTSRNEQRQHEGLSNIAKALRNRLGEADGSYPGAISEYAANGNSGNGVLGGLEAAGIGVRDDPFSISSRADVDKAEILSPAGRDKGGT